MIKCSTKFKSNQFNSMHFILAGFGFDEFPNGTNPQSSTRGATRGASAPALSTRTSSWTSRTRGAEVPPQRPGGTASTTATRRIRPAAPLDSTACRRLARGSRRGTRSTPNVRRVGKHKEHEGACVQLVRLLNGAAGGVGYSGVPSR